MSDRLFKIGLAGILVMLLGKYGWEKLSLSDFFEKRTWTESGYVYESEISHKEPSYYQMDTITNPYIPEAFLSGYFPMYAPFVSEDSLIELPRYYFYTHPDSMILTPEERDIALANGDSSVLTMEYPVSNLVKLYYSDSTGNPAWVTFHDTSGREIVSLRYRDIKTFLE